MFLLLLLLPPLTLLPIEPMEGVLLGMPILDWEEVLLSVTIIRTIPRQYVTFSVEWGQDLWFGFIVGRDNNWTSYDDAADFFGHHNFEDMGTQRQKRLQEITMDHQ